MDVLEQFSRLDKEVRASEKQVHSIEAQIESQKNREREVYARCGVAGYDELKKKVAILEGEVGKRLEEWSLRVAKVNEALSAAENRVGVR